MVDKFFESEYDKLVPRDPGVKGRNGDEICHIREKDNLSQAIKGGPLWM
jgi:hypothetical protein